MPPGSSPTTSTSTSRTTTTGQLTEGVSLVVTGDPERRRAGRVRGVDRRRVGRRGRCAVRAGRRRRRVRDRFASTDPALDGAAQDAVRDIRDLAVPGDGDLLVTGNTARFIDEKSSLRSNAPPVIALIVALTVVLLFLLTGSVLLPLKTLLMNALTLAAVLGILVIVFQRKVGTRAARLPGSVRRRGHQPGVPVRGHLRAGDGLRRAGDGADQGAPRRAACPTRRPSRRALPGPAGSSAPPP